MQRTTAMQQQHSRQAVHGGVIRCQAGSHAPTPLQARRAGTVGSALALRSHTQPPLAQPLPRLTARQPPVRLCRSSSSNSEGPGGSSSSSTAEEQQPSVLYSVVPLALWAGLMGYVFLVAPNQTPGIDSFVVQKLVGLQPDDPFHVNEVFVSVWNCMGLYPLLYAAMLIPAARGGGKLPAWPFVCASVFLGAYALIPYMCLWTPQQQPEQLPLPASELEGWNKGFMRAAETPWLPAGLLAGAAYWVWHALSAGGQEWLQYVRIFDESRLTHATSIDFALCTLLMPFWMGNDAQRRNWANRDTLVPLLSLLPLVGPALYLVLRPKTYGSSSSSSSSS